MNAETIKSFLVGLGFGIDESSLAKFNKAILGATLKVTALASTVKLTAIGIFYGISRISDSFEQLGYELRLISPAITKTLQLRQAMLYAYSKAGVDIAKAAQQSILFNFSLAKTKFALEALYRSVGARFIPILTKQMDIFRKKIFDNMPKIQAKLERFIKFIFNAFEVVILFGSRIFSTLGRVYDLFVDLDKATSGWSTVLLGVLAIWKLLNLSFLFSPLGALLAGLTSLLVLYDDYKTQQEGGESLFDWTAFKPLINDAIKTFQSLFSVLVGIANVFKGIVLTAKSLLTLNFSSLISSLGTIGNGLSSIGGGLFDAAKTVVGSFGDMQKAITGFGFAQPQIASASPIGSQITNSQSSQRISQETNIVVQGSADASATGRAVASEQNRVNFDMVRNMRGATR